MAPIALVFIINDIYKMTVSCGGDAPMDGSNIIILGSCFMWVMLTNKDLEPVLVNFARIAYVSPRTGGGSTLNFAEDAAEKDGVVKPKALAVRESVIDITKAVSGEGPEPARAGKRSRRAAESDA